MNLKNELADLAVMVAIDCAEHRMRRLKLWVIPLAVMIPVGYLLWVLA